MPADAHVGDPPPPPANGAPSSSSSPRAPTLQRRRATAWEGVECVVFEDQRVKAGRALSPDPNGRRPEGEGGGRPRESPEPEPEPPLTVSTMEYSAWIRHRASPDGDGDDDDDDEASTRPPPPGKGAYLSWEFDVLSYPEAALEGVAVGIFEHYDLPAEFGIAPEVLAAFVAEVRRRHDCTLRYHNWHHAVATLHASFLFLSLGCADRYLEGRDVLGTLLGSLVHDVDHAGNDNDFEVRSRTDRAARYGGESVLENHSLDVTFGSILSDPRRDVLRNLSDSDGRYVRNLAREVVIATDPAHHRRIMDDLTSLADSVADADDDDADTAAGDGTKPRRRRRRDPFDRSDPRSRLLLARSIVHAADVAGTVHPSFPVARDWCMRVMVEFASQANREVRLGLPATPHMTGIEDEGKIARQQIGFFEYLCRPLFRVLGALLPPEGSAGTLEGNGARHCNRYREIADLAEGRANGHGKGGDGGGGGEGARN